MASDSVDGFACQHGSDTVGGQRGGQCCVVYMLLREH